MCQSKNVAGAYSNSAVKWKTVFLIYYLFFVDMHVKLCQKMFKCRELAKQEVRIWIVAGRVTEANINRKQSGGVTVETTCWHATWSLSKTTNLKLFFLFYTNKVVVSDLQS